MGNLAQSLDHAAKLTTGLADEIVARRLLRGVAQQLYDSPDEFHQEQAATMLSQAVIAELDDYKQRLLKQCERLMDEFWKRSA